MADDQVDLGFLGERIKRVQGDVRVLKTDVAQLRADNSRLENKVEGLEGKVDGIESKLDNGFRAIDARFEQVFRTIATNTQMIIEAIRGKLGG